VSSFINLVSAGFAKKVGGFGWSLMLLSGRFGWFQLVPPFSMYHKYKYFPANNLYIYL